MINPRTPRMHLLTGSEWSLAITDSGAGISVCRGLDIHMRSGDLLRRPQGIFAYADAGEGAFSLTAAPDYRYTAFPKRGPARVERRAEFGEGYAAFFAGQGSLETGMRVTVHPRLPSEQRQVALKNRSNRRLTCQLLFYFEPCLARREDAAAHPAFSRLFLSVRRDEASSALFFTRRQRQGEPPVCLAAGLLDGGPFDYEPSRERLLTRPEGTLSLGEEMGRPFSCQGSGVPDCAAALRVTVELPPRAQRTVTLLLAAAPTESEAATRLIELRREGGLTADRAARSPFGGVEAQLAAHTCPICSIRPACPGNGRRQPGQPPRAVRSLVPGDFRRRSSAPAGDPQRRRRLPSGAVYAPAPFPSPGRCNHRAGPGLPGRARLRHPAAGCHPGSRPIRPV